MVNEEDVKPPVLGSWRRLYLAVLLYLLLIIAALALFAASFRL